MNISYNWLKQYLDFDLTPDDLAAALTSIGLETGGIEKVESVRGGLRGIVIGKVLTCEEHPNSDHLHITTVDLGLPGGEPTQIVCGAPNVAAGQTVVVATVGTTLYGEGDETFTIKKSKIRGVESFGMICAEDEIGVGTSHDGIIVITDEVAPGTPAAEYYKLKDDYVLEVDLTPNRIDAASHYGVARDLSAWLACHAKAAELKRPDVTALKSDKPDGDAIKVEVDDKKACIRYCGLTIRNGGKVIVKTCPEGTPFTTLDGVERKLNAADLMICNEREPMCIAGVFGGLDSGVTDATTSVFLESACFNPTSVRRTARRHGLSTDSSFRFERGVDPNGCVYALKLAAQLVKELAGGEICGDIVDIYPEIVEPYPVELSYKRLNSLAGDDIARDTVDSILASLEIEIKERRDGGETLELAVPTYRVDVRRDCAVIEDILRIYGYNNIPMPDAVKSSLSYKSATDFADDLTKTLSEQLTAMGFNEILNNSLTAEAYYKGLATYSADNCVRLLNPLSQDLNVMRQTLLFGGLESIAHNVNRRSADLRFYEFGNVYHFNPDAVSTPEAPLAPFSEGKRLALWLTGDIRRATWSAPAVEATFYDLRAYVDNIMARLGLSPRSLSYEQFNDDIFAAALRVATRSGKQLGALGVVRPDIAARADVSRPVFYCEFDWAALVSLAAAVDVKYAPLPKTQPVKRDLSLLIDTSVSLADIEKVVRDSERKLLRSVELFDVYEGKNLPAGKKSYAISMTLQDDEKTLQDKHIDQIMNKIIANLKNKLGAELR